jgi:Skp family chaperone for outer membrane proteins/CBS domain-containing protein
LKAILKARTNCYLASAELATLHMNHGRDNRALEAIDLIATDYRRWSVPDPDWNYVASKVYSKLSDYSSTKNLAGRAIEQLREELQKNPANALAYAKTGLCSLLMEDLSGAEGEFQKFINRTRPEERSSVVKELQVLISQQIVQDDAKYILTKYFSQAGTEKKEERIDSLPVTVTSRDTVAPKIVILEPKDVRGMKVLDAGKYSLAVSGFVSDANGVSVVYVNGIVASMSAPTTTEAGASGLAGKILKFSADVMSPVGESIVDVRAVDLYGNQGKSTFKIRRDAPAAIAPTDDQPTQPRLKLPAIWAVVIGISEYQNKELQLNYAHRDAQAYYSFLKSPFGGAIQEDRIEILTNRNATRADIIRALNEKLRMAFEDDMVIIYIASHGVPEEVSGELYFLGYDADTKNIAGTAISQIDVQKAIATARAKKILLIADACHSGSVGLSPSIARRGSVATYVNRLLKEIASARDGVAILTASSANEFSQEGAQWGGGHGVFTNHLINGLKGQADSDGDGYVTIRELYEFVYRKVADDTGGKQHPDLQGKFDNKLPVGVVK